MANAVPAVTPIDAKHINIFIVSGIIQPGAATDPARNDWALGVQGYFDIAQCGNALIKEAILLTPFAAALPPRVPPWPAGTTVPHASDNTMSHELGHRILKRLVDGTLTNAGYVVAPAGERTHKGSDAAGNCLSPSHIMCPLDQLANALWFVDGVDATRKDDDLLNVRRTTREPICFCRTRVCHESSNFRDAEP